MTLPKPYLTDELYVAYHEQILSFSIPLRFPNSWNLQEPQKVYFWTIFEPFLLRVKEFLEKLTRKEKAVWNSFVTAVWGFQGQAQSWKRCGAAWDSGEELLHSELQDVSQSPVLDAYVDHLRKNMGVYSEELAPLNTTTKDNITRTWWATTN